MSIPSHEPSPPSESASATPTTHQGQSSAASASNASTSASASVSTASQEHAAVPDAIDHHDARNQLAQALRDLARGEHAASALETNLTSLETKLDELLAAFEQPQAATSHLGREQQGGNGGISGPAQSGAGNDARQDSQGD